MPDDEPAEKPDEEPDEEPAAKPRRPRLGAVGIAVADLERSAAFYRATFGLVDVMRFDLPHMQEIVLGFEGGRGAALVLMQYTNGSENRTTGDPLKLVMYVLDPEAVAAAAAANGGRITVPPARRPSLRNALVGFVKDPDGHLIELLEA